MNKIFKTAILGIAMMFSVNFAFAQEATGSGDPEVDYSTQTLGQGASIFVTIVEKGHNCPPNGIIKSNWKWMQGGDPYPVWKEGTSAEYYEVPSTVQALNGGIWYTPQQVEITIEPNAKYGKNVIYVNKPFNPVEISAGNCYPGEQNVIYPNTTE